MSKLNCGVVRDLLPLCQDGVASGESKALVEEHLKECPACREELAKLSAPVSVPPEEDGKEREIREKLRQNVKEHRRRKWIIRIAGLAALASVILFCSWYTRPQDFYDVTGQPWNFIHLSAALQAPITVGSETVTKEWRISLDQNPEEEFSRDMDLFKVALNGIQGFRAPLSSIPHNLLLPECTFRVDSPDGILYLTLTRADDTTVHITVYGDTNKSTLHIQEWEKDSERLIRDAYYHTAPVVFEVLALTMQSHGTPTF